jgi:molecular chaperone GrpE
MTDETPTAPVNAEAPILDTDWKDKYLRTLAEMENMRKRMQKERQEMTRFSIENAISEFLPAIDNFENALRFAEGAGGEVKSWAMGFEMILSQFKEVLHNHGIVAFHSEGNTFDALHHEAVEIVETNDHPNGIILQEFSKGYKSSGRTIRPARVKVAKRPEITTNAALDAEEIIQNEQVNYDI